MSAPKTGKKDKTPAPTTAEPEPAKDAVNPTTPTSAEEKVEDAAAAGTTVSADNSAASETAPAPEKPKKLTLEVVRAAGVGAAKKHGKETVKGILDGLGEVGMASMNPSNYEEFMRKLGELDAG